MRVLVADDNREMRSALRLVVGEISPQCRVEEAADGAQVQALLRKEVFHVLLFDWGLPGLDASRLQTDLEALSPGCVAIAVSGNPEARSGSEAAWVPHFIGTNDPPARLLDLLRDLLPC